MHMFFIRVALFASFYIVLHRFIVPFLQHLGKLLKLVARVMKIAPKLCILYYEEIDRFSWIGFE